MSRTSHPRFLALSAPFLFAILPGSLETQAPPGALCYEGVIGMGHEASVQRFLTGLPVRFEPATRDLRLDSTVFDVDPRTGRALGVRRIQKRLREE